MTHRYRVFGLGIASQFALPDLRPDDSAPAEVAIRLGTVNAEGREAGYHQIDGATLLVVPEIARFRIVGGRGITVDPAADAAEGDVRLFVLGSAMGALLHQRGLLPLHANVVGVADGAVALMGRSGAGKSTLAGWFHDQGFPVLSDDLCVVDDGGIAAPGIPRLRLWRDALAASGRTPDGYAPSYRGADKFDVPIAGAAPEPRRLRAVYLLGQADAATIAPLTGAAAVAALVANTYRGEFVRAAGLTGAHLQACVALARAVPVFAFDRAWDASRIDAGARALVAHAAALR